MTKLPKQRFLNQCACESLSLSFQYPTSHALRLSRCLPRVVLRPEITKSKNEVKLVKVIGKIR